MKKQKDVKNKKTIRIIMYIVIVVLIILALISSCSCTSGLWGRIGNMFQNVGHYIFDNNTPNKEVIKDKELKFDTKDVNISLDNDATKVSFTIKKIKSDNITVI